MVLRCVMRYSLAKGSSSLFLMVRRFRRRILKSFGNPLHFALCGSVALLPASFLVCANKILAAAGTCRTQSCACDTGY